MSGSKRIETYQNELRKLGVDARRVQHDAYDEDDRLIHDAATANLVQCDICDRGFRRVGGTHIPSQRLGMIPNTPCQRVFATQIIGNKRPWRAYVDGEPLRDKYGMPRHYATAKSAYAAACKAAPRKWHP